MTMLSVRVLIVLIGIAITACEEEVAAPEPVRPAFTQGQWWTYTWEASIDTSGTPDVISRDSIRVIVASTNAEVAGMAELVCLEAYSLRSAVPSVERVYYQHSSGALLEVAYQSPQTLPVIHLKSLSGMALGVRPSVFDPLHSYPSRVSSDSIQQREEPRIVLQYPLVPGARWTALTVPFRQTRDVVAVSPVTAPDGSSLEAATVSTTNEYFSSGDTWLDVITRRGMFSRSIRVVLEMYDEYMQPMGTGIFTETLSLVAQSDG